MRFRSIEEMPPGLRKMFDAQFEKTEDGKIVEKKPIVVNNRVIVKVPEQKVQSSIIQDPVDFIPHKAMNVGVDQVALEGLNKTETRYLAILRERDDLVWIGVHSFRLRMAANTHFTPDFVTLDNKGQMTMIDTKGGWTREDAQLKIKLAARMFPMFRWVKAELILSTRKRPESLNEIVIKN